MNNAKINIVQSWLDNVAYNHSGSEHTKTEYQRNLKKFCNFITKSPEDILREYENSSDRQFKRKYAQYLKAWISQLLRQGYTKSSIRVMAGSVKSFCKYSDLPLGYVPLGNAQVVYHNRDITKEEITLILDVAVPRDRSFFATMSQSGLRPFTICLLKVKHVEKILQEDTPIPCKIESPAELTKGKFRSHFTFIGSEAVRYLKAYLNTRENLEPNSWLYSQHAEEKKLDRKTMSHRFRDAVIKLKKKELIEYTQKAKGKAGSIRLYSLRKWFRNQASQAGVDFVNFWMGHKLNYKAPEVPASDEHYFSRKLVEKHRVLFAEKAMPYLTLEAETPSELKRITEQQAKEVEKLRKQLKESQLKLQPLSKLIESMSPEDLKLFVKGWQETAEFWKTQKAKEQGKPYNRIIQVELTEDQAAKFGSISDNVNMKLAKILQNALNVALENVAEESDKE